MNELMLDEPRSYADPDQSLSKLHRIQFTGTANEYFRIWIVNLFLSVITLGIYAAWAKVRARQYLYSNTQLDGQGFEYLGDPIAILKGNILVAIAAACYYFSQLYQEVWMYVLLGIFGLLYPYLMYKSMRFMASSSAYRNIRFKFWGSLSDAYKYYLWWLLLVPPSLGLLFPLVHYYQRKYLLDNVSLGTAQSQFKGDVGRFYVVYLIAYGISIGMTAIFTLIAFTSVFGAILSGADPDSILANVGSIITLFVMGLAYVVMLLVGVGLQQYIYAQLLNHSLDNTSLNDGQIRFRSRINQWTLIKIQLVNILAIVVSLGLLSPWAKIRYLKYVISRIGVIAPAGALDGLVAVSSQEDNAIGDAAAGFMDFDIGL